MKIRRILAWIIDWNLCGIPALIYAFVFKAIMETRGEKAVFILLYLLFLLSFPVLFVFRDLLFGGRSIAKRIFRLRIIDNRTNELPSKPKLILRNLFFEVYPAEAILLLAINKSLGDLVTKTTVVKN